MLYQSVVPMVTFQYLFDKNDDDDDDCVYDNVDDLDVRSLCLDYD